MGAAGVDSTELFSIEATNELVVQPLLAQSVALGGLRIITTSATSLWLPAVTHGEASFYDDLDEIVESGAAAGETEIRPKSVKAIRTFSTESAQDAGAASLLGAALVAELAAATDKAAFTTGGGGAKGPTGLNGIVGVSTVVGALDDLDSITDALTKIEDAGGSPSRIFMSPTTWGLLSKIRAIAGGAAPVIGGANVAVAAPKALFGVEVRVSKYVEANTVWVVDGERTVAIVRTPFSVVVDASSAFTQDALRVRATGRLEFASLYPTTVCKITTV